MTRQFKKIFFFHRKFDIAPNFVCVKKLITTHSSRRDSEICLLFRVIKITSMKLVVKVLFIFILSVFAINGQSQSITGIWKTIDDTDNIEKSHIEIYEDGGKYFGKVIKLLEGASVYTCEKCKGEKKGKSLINMVILESLEKENQAWRNGHILDPATGKIYQCNVELESNDKLKLRGYIGLPAFGRTQYWYRVNE